MLAAAAVVAVFLARGGDTHPTPTAAGIAPVTRGPVQFYPQVGHAQSQWTSRPIPGPGTVVSFDLTLAPGARAAVGLDAAGPSLTFSRSTELARYAGAGFRDYTGFYVIEHRAP